MIVAEGANAASLNPIWHGEMMAITNLSQRSPGVSVYELAPKLDLYTSAEPCPMCAGAIAWSGFRSVVYGTSIQYITQQGQEQIDISAEHVFSKTPFHNITTVGGVLHEETDKLYQNKPQKHRNHLKESEVQEFKRQIAAPNS